MGGGARRCLHRCLEISAHATKKIKRDSTFAKLMRPATELGGGVGEDNIVSSCPFVVGSFCFGPLHNHDWFIGSHPLVLNIQAHGRNNPEKNQVQNYSKVTAQLSTLTCFHEQNKRRSLFSSRHDSGPSFPLNATSLVCEPARVPIFTSCRLFGARAYQRHMWCADALVRKERVLRRDKICFGLRR